MTRGICILLIALAAIVAPVISPRAETPRVALALVLAIDTSGSVDKNRYELQLRGYAAALRSEAVADAIESLGKPTAITFVQWAAPVQQEQSIGWAFIRDRRDLRTLADKVENMQRIYSGHYTAIGEAIDYCADLLDSAPFVAGRRIIDISGDGTDDGRVVASRARDRAVGRGITINGLPIIREDLGMIDVAYHYEHHVIGGYKAFLVAANGDADFPRAILRKLETEIAAR